MTKTLLTISCAFLCITQVQAQITLAKSSYTAIFAGTTDSASIAYGSLPSLQTGNNASWDLSTITYAVIDTPYVMHNTGPAGSLYADYVHNFVSGNLYYNSRPYFVIDSASFRQPGETIDGRGYSLSSIPNANPTDSLIFMPQTNVYTAPLTKVKFPASYLSTWSSSYVSSVYFTISYSIVYNHDTGIFRSYITEYDTVIGWGKMKVKKPDGSASDTINVLQVKVNYQRMDSFFVGGTASNPTPANSLLLSQFGLSQGNITTSYEYRYFRPNEVTPLADVYFVNSNYDNTNVNKTVVHQQRLTNADTTTSVTNVGNDNNIQVYPNPVYAHTLYIDLPATKGGNWYYQLTNLPGQSVTNGTLNKGGSENIIRVPSEIAPGLYYLRIYNDNKDFYVKPVNILK